MRHAMHAREQQGVGRIKLPGVRAGKRRGHRALQQVDGRQMRGEKRAVRELDVHVDHVRFAGQHLTLPQILLHQPHAAHQIAGTVAHRFQHVAGNATLRARHQHVEVGARAAHGSG